MRMAADQRRKLLNGSANGGGSFLVQSRAKRKRLESAEDGSNAKYHISLKWDENQGRVIAKKEQIGISWRDLRPFVDSLPHSHNILADALDIPREIFELETLKDVLSHEAWKSCLSQRERSYLMQFLPRETDAQQVVKSLLTGENFHFGNPFSRWGASLQLGNLHPDAVAQHERHLKAEKKAYYTQLKKYHNDLIASLLKLKERWESCRDPENEFVQKSSRSKKKVAKKFSSHANGSMFHELEESVSASSEFSSWDGDEKSTNSDKNISSILKGGELKKRLSEKGKGKIRNSLTISDNVLNGEAKPKRGKKLYKSSIVYNDGAKYMSYIKISKKQHELAKSMEQSGATIHSKSLRPLLGDLDDLHVQPYEVFVEEERKNLHEHWLKLAKEDLPSACAAWGNIQRQKLQIVRTLGEELKEKVDCVMEVDQDEEEITGGISVDVKVHDGHSTPNVETESESLLSSPESQKDNRITEFTCDGEDDDESVPGFSHDRTNAQAAGLASVVKNNQEPFPDSQHDLNDAAASLHSVSTVQGDESSVPVSSHNQSLEEISSLSVSHNFNHLNLEPLDNRATSKSDNSSQDVSAFSGNLSQTEMMAGHGVPLSSGSNIWQPVGMLHPYYDSNAGPQNNTASELRLTDPPINNEQRGHWIDLECNMHEPSNGGSLKSYPNQDQNELLQSILKGQDMMSYNQDQKPAELNFAPPNSVLMEDSRFPRHFQEQPSLSLPLDQGQKTANEVVYNNFLPDGGRFLIQRQEQLLPVSMHDWPVNSVRMPDTLQPPLIGGDLPSHNWFSGERHGRVGWTSSGTMCAPSQSIGSTGSLDQGLYSVLSHCSQLRPPSTSYEAIGSTDQFIQSRNYGLVSGSMPGINNVLPPTAHSLDYLNRRDATSSLMPNDTGWMNLPHQSSSLNDSMGKPFLGSWNQ